MPMKFGAPSDLPPDLAAAAEQSDEAVGSTLSGLIPDPDRPYSPKAVNALAKAVAAALAVVGITDVELEDYSGPVERLDEEDVRFIAMLSQIAADYGKPFPVPLGEIRGDNELTALASHITMMAKDPELKAFLDEDQAMAEDLSDMGPDEELDAAMAEGDEDEDEEVEVEVRAKGPRKPVKGDDFFSSRMRR